MTRCPPAIAGRARAQRQDQKLFEIKRISSGIAAGLAGLDRATFLLSLYRYEVPLADLGQDALLSELNNA